MKIRDPIHGFIEFSEDEMRIINSAPFQRLRHIRQLALTSLIYPGAVHTRFEHSLGVTYLVTQAFDSAIKNAEETGNCPFSNEKIDIYRQLLRIIALTHDIGHAPLSHASEKLFPEGMEHENYTELILCQTEIAEIINQIGDKFEAKYPNFCKITPELICEIYAGSNPGDNCEYTFLKSFMDSELDCDKMDYLLRDSYYCGVKYGNYDKDRLLESFTIYTNSDGVPRLAIKKGGEQAFEEFVLARYFMFVQVYFHKTRRYFDKIFLKALECILPKGKYPKNVDEYLKWDDDMVFQKIREHMDDNVECKNIIQREVYSCVFETKAHPSDGDLREYNLIYNELKNKVGQQYLLKDVDAGKSPHKIPIRSEINDEKTIMIYDAKKNRKRTISEESEIIRSLGTKIDIRRIYCEHSKCPEAIEIVRSYNDMQEVGDDE